MAGPVFASPTANMLVDAKGSRWRVLNVLGNGDLLVEDVTGANGIQRIRTGDITGFPSEDAAATSSMPEIASLRGPEWEVAQRRFAAIEPLLNKTVRTRGEVEAAAASMGVTATTIYEWIKAYQSSEHLSSLVPMKVGRKTGKTMISTEAEALIAAAIDEHHLTARRKKVSKVIEAVMIDGEGAQPTIRLPHANTIRRRVRAIDPLIRARRRGERAEAESLEPFPGEYPAVDRPFQVVQIDHTHLDCIVLDDEGEPLHRPWITLIIDVFTRMVVGIALSLERPNAAMAGICTCQVMLPKGPVLEAVGVEADWPSSGKPEKVQMDNAKEFDSRTFKRALEAYGIQYEFRPVATPRYGAHIERLMRTTSEEIQTLPGTTFSNVRAKKENKPAREAIFTFDELETYVYDWFTNTYNQKRHGGIGMPPIQKYRNAILGTPTTKGLGLPKLPTDPARLRIDFLPVFEVTIQQGGARIEHIDYYDSVLSPHIREKVGPLSRKSRKFIFRRDPRKISPVYYWDERGKTHIPIPYANRTNPVISIWEHRAAIRRLKAEGKKVDEATIMGSYQRRRRMIETATSRKLARDKSLRRDKARLGATRRAVAQGPADPPNLRTPALAAPPTGSDYDFSRPIKAPDVIDLEPTEVPPRPKVRTRY